MLNKICRAWFAFLLLAPVCLAVSPSRFEFAEIHMGTQFRIVLYATDGRTARQAAQAAFTRIARLDATMSDYNEASELNRLCHSPPNHPVRVSRDLFRILEISQRLAARSGGAFDITVGAVVRLWRRARRTGELPSAEKRQQALAVTGYHLLHLNPKRQAAWLERAGVLLDLGGIAKGFAADEAVAILRRRGIRSALVAAGGDIVVSDAPPNQRGWAIEIAPVKAAGQPGSTIYLKNAAISTSGDAEQSVEITGARYSHIVDPLTGMGLTAQISVTVVSRRGVDADSLATAVSVLGKERGLAFIDETRDAAALMVQKTNNSFEIFASQRWSSGVASSR